MTRKKERKAEPVFGFVTVFGRKYRATGKTWIDAFLNWSRRKHLLKEEKQEGVVHCYKERATDTPA